MNTTSLLAALTASLLVSSLTGQGTPKVIPAAATTVDGNSSSPFPYVYNKTRVQHLIDGSTFCKTSAVLFEFSYRIDGALTRSTSALLVSNLTVTVGYSSKSATTMSNNFAANRTGTQTPIFTGNYNLPAQPIPTKGLGKFNVTYKFPKPITYLRSSGNLLIEFMVPGQANKKTQYSLDAALSGPSIAYRGTPGLFGNNSQSYLYNNNIAALTVGGLIDMSNRSMRSAYPTLHVYGFSNSQFGPFQLPLNLTNAGAPGNFLQNSMDLMFAASLAQVGSTWSATTKLSIPNNPLFGGATLHVTNVCLDKTANNLNLVFGRGLSLNIGGGSGPGMNLLYQQNSTSATGFYFRSQTSPGGPVIQLKGAFN